MPYKQSEQQPTDKNLELSSAFAGKFEGGADKTPAAKSEKLFECKGCTILASNGLYAIVDWLHVHKWKIENNVKRTTLDSFIYHQNVN